MYSENTDMSASKTGSSGHAETLVAQGFDDLLVPGCSLRRADRVRRAILSQCHSHHMQAGVLRRYVFD